MREIVSVNLLFKFKLDFIAVNHLCHTIASTQSTKLCLCQLGFLIKALRSTYDCDSYKFFDELEKHKKECTMHRCITHFVESF
jgi:hypothetical protein